MKGLVTFTLFVEQLFHSSDGEVRHDKEMGRSFSCIGSNSLWSSEEQRNGIGPCRECQFKKWIALYDPTNNGVFVTQTFKATNE